VSSYLTPELTNEYIDIDIEVLKKMSRENLKDQIIGQNITFDAYQGRRSNVASNGTNLRHEMYNETLVKDPLTDGFKIQYPHGIILSQSMRSDFYRGENKLYEASIPSLLRKLQNFDTVKEKELYRLISDMRVAEFSIFLSKFDHVAGWNYCDVLYDVLAQHYGLDTGWLDITNDFNTALFFATCHYDGSGWKPLTREDTEKNEMTKYGVIFHIPSFKASEKMAASIWDEYSTDGSNGRRPMTHDHNTILPIGFQPFMRCHMQYGYGIYMRKPFPLQNDIHFEKLRFRHSEELSQYIFNLMEGGKLIYPQEGLSDSGFIIDMIKTSTVFSNKAFEYALKRNHYYRISDREECLKDLADFPVGSERIRIIEKHPWHLSSLRKKKINSAYNNFSIEHKYNIKIMSRMVSPGGAPMYAPWMIAEDDTFKGVYDMEPRKVECYSLWARHMEYILSTIENAKIPDYL
jgi:hypothetical protein